jgi:hypothetical protein
MTTDNTPDHRVEVEQALIDISGEVKSAVLELSQTLADISERLSDGALADKKMAAFEGLMNEVSAALADVLGRDNSAALAKALVDGLKDAIPKQQKVEPPIVNVEVAAPQVNVAAPIVNIQPPAVQFNPVIQVPKSPAAQVTVIGSTSWHADFNYNEYGRITSATLKKTA